VGHAVGPFAQQGLDVERRATGSRPPRGLGLAVGLRGAGAGEDVSDARPLQRLREAAGAVGASVVRHPLLGPDAMRPEPAQGAQQEAGGGVAAFVGERLDIGQPRRVIDRDMDEGPACAQVAAALARPRDAVTGPVEATQLLDVELDQFAGAGALARLVRAAPPPARNRASPLRKVRRETPNAAACCPAVRRATICSRPQTARRAA